MQTNQELNKEIMVLNFSILGVGEFKTVAVVGSNVQKRVFSAVNQMDRLIKKEADVSVGSHLYDGTVSYRMAADLMKSVHDQAMVQEDNSVYVVDETPIAVLTTQEFLEQSSSIYKDNVSKFIANLNAIAKALSEHIQGRQEEGVKKHVPVDELLPRLFPCTSPEDGFCRGKKLYVVMSHQAMKEYSKTDELDYELALRNFCLKALQSVKNYKLTDYLRAPTEQKKSMIAKQIKIIDKEIDNLDTIAVEEGGPLAGQVISYESRTQSSRATELKRASTSLKLESEMRLIDHVHSLLVEMP